MPKRLSLIFATLLAASPSLVLAAEVTAEIEDSDGNSVGAISLSDTSSGMVHAVLEMTDVPEGVHGMHLHETGDCSADDFSSAGGHLAGDAQHGILVDGGPHPGDLPNVTVSESGTVDIELFVTGLDIEETIMDDDGAAFVMHAGPDDYESQPSGDSGDRIACGVFRERQ